MYDLLKQGHYIMPINTAPFPADQNDKTFTPMVTHDGKVRCAIFNRQTDEFIQEVDI